VYISINITGRDQRAIDLELKIQHLHIFRGDWKHHLN